MIKKSNLRRVTNQAAAAVAIVALASCSEHGSGDTHGSVANRALQTPPAHATKAADADTAWLALRAVAALAETFRALGLEATEQGTTVFVAGRRIGVTARINNKLAQGSRHILAAEFDIFVDGARMPTLRAGAIGVDDTPELARAAAAAEWAAEYGAPIGFAMGTQFGGRGPPPGNSSIASFYAKLEVDGQALFHGPPGLRGEAMAPSTVSSDAFVRKIAEPVVASLRRARQANEYRSATVQVVVTGRAVTDGECRIDGVISPELLQALSKLSWPEGSPAYMFKLFFVGPVTRG